MIPAFTEGGKERENLTTMARSCSGVGSALVTIITMKCVYMLGQGNERTGFRWFALIVAVLFVLFITITCLTIREKSTVHMETPTVRQMFSALIHNDQAMTVVITIVLINCSLYITSNLLLYFFKYDVSGESWYNSYTLFSTFGGAVQILSMMVLFPLLRKFMSSIRVFYLSFGMAIAGYAILLVLMIGGHTALGALVVPGFLIFAAFGMLTVLTTVFLANTVDYGEMKNHRRDESVIFSMQTFVVKLASGIAGFISSMVLFVFHISSNKEAVVTEPIAASSRMGLRLSMTIIPIVVLVIGFIVFKKRYILTDRKLAEISKELEKKHQN